MLDNWIKEKYFPVSGFNREQLEIWQQERIKEIFLLAKEKSVFYRKLYEGVTMPENRADFQRLPTVDSETLKRDGGKMLCVSQKEIKRVVSLETSGTTDRPKRLFFTKEDQELTIDFFAHGMKALADSGETVAVCLPFKTPGSVGDLLIQGLSRQGIIGRGVGILEDLKAAVEQIIMSKARTVVGIPVQILGLMEYAAGQGVSLPLRRALTSTESLPAALRIRLEQFGLEIYNHFGMTECGLGVALECGLHRGMHIRENDLIIEIIDEDQRPVRDGCFGEVAVTTLTRVGMPLIRYRTGDKGRILPGVCGCGSILRRLEPAGRLREVQFLGKTIHEWDAYFFTFHNIIDYRLERKKEGFKLNIYIMDALPLKVKEAIEEKIEGNAEVSFLNIVDRLPVYRGKRRFMREESI